MHHHDAFDHAFLGLSPREAVYVYPQQRLVLETAYQAVEASGYLRTHKKEAGDNVGVFIGKIASIISRTPPRMAPRRTPPLGH